MLSLILMMIKKRKVEAIKLPSSSVFHEPTTFTAKDANKETFSRKTNSGPVCVPSLKRFSSTNAQKDIEVKKKEDNAQFVSNTDDIKPDSVDNIKNDRKKVEPIKIPTPTVIRKNTNSTITAKVLNKENSSKKTMSDNEHDCVSFLQSLPPVLSQKNRSFFVIFR